MSLVGLVAAPMKTVEVLKAVVRRPGAELAKAAGWVALCVLVTLLVVEWLAFVATAGLRCSTAWAGELRDGAMALQDVDVLVVSDVHVLGERQRSWVDRWWTDRQLWRSVIGATTWFRPDAFVSLGDHLDEGFRYTDIKTWQRYVSRFRGALLVYPNTTAILGTIGNHDAATGRLMTSRMVGRFQASFGPVNGVTRVGKGSLEIIQVNEMVFDRCHGFGEDMSRTDPDPLCANVNNFLHDLQQADSMRHTDRPRPFRLLLLHMPLYRENDLGCGKERIAEGGDVTFSEPHVPLEVGHDVLSRQASEALLDRIKPDLVLSGHTHAQCYIQHRDLVRGGPSQVAVQEITLPTFSWRMRRDPSFAVLRVNKAQQTIEYQLCRLPEEHHMIALYVATGLCGALLSIAAFARSSVARFPVKSDRAK